MTQINSQEGKTLFGLNPDNYDQARPAYPNWMFSILKDQKAIFPGAVTLEIGAGNGLATRPLIEQGAEPLTLIESDERFAPLLRSIADEASGKCSIFHEPFESVQLPEASFDLAVIATAFHWLDPDTRVAKLAKVLRANGYVALLWNLFQDPSRPDPFHDATNELLANLAVSPSDTKDRLPFALDRQTIEKEFNQRDAFELVMYAESHWTLTYTTAQIVQLYEGFSGILRLSNNDRKQLLDRLAQIVEVDFGGVAQRNMTSPLYLFRRRS